MNLFSQTVLPKAFVGLIMAIVFLGGAPAMAEYRPNYCPVAHDHRSHDASYYRYYDGDDYYRAGPYRGARSDDRYNSRGRYQGDRRRARSRVVHRDTFQTRWRARIIVVEEVYYTRSGREQLVCTVLARGPEARYVPRRRLNRVAQRNCSEYARVQYRSRRGY